MIRVSEADEVMIRLRMYSIFWRKESRVKTIEVLTGYIKREEFEKAGADYILEQRL